MNARKIQVRILFGGAFLLMTDGAMAVNNIKVYNGNLVNDKTITIKVKKIDGSQLCKFNNIILTGDYQTLPCPGLEDIKSPEDLIISFVPENDVACSPLTVNFDKNEDIIVTVVSKKSCKVQARRGS